MPTTTANSINMRTPSTTTTKCSIRFFYFLFVCVCVSLSLSVCVSLYVCLSRYFSLLQVVLLLGACPFPERLDLPWFSTALAALGPRFHALSVRVALGIPSPAARTTAVLRAAEEGGAAISVVLDELCPLPAGGGGSGVWSGGEVLANQVGVGEPLSGRGYLRAAAFWFWFDQPG